MVVRILVVLGLLLTTLAPTLAPVTGEARKKTRHKTVTRWFIDESTGVYTIPEQGNATVYPILIPVKGLRKGKIRDLNARIQFCHDFSDDVDMLLVAPNGKNALIMSDAGGSYPTKVEMTLDDEAAEALPDSEPIGGEGSQYSCSAGYNEIVRYRPANYTPIADSDAFPGAPAPSGAVSLSTFDGSKPNGTWRLYVRDDFVSGGGHILAVELIITARVKK